MAHTPTMALHRSGGALLSSRIAGIARRFLLGFVELRLGRLRSSTLIGRLFLLGLGLCPRFGAQAALFRSGGVASLGNRPSFREDGWIDRRLGAQLIEYLLLGALRERGALGEAGRFISGHEFYNVPFVEDALRGRRRYQPRLPLM